MKNRLGVEAHDSDQPGGVERRAADRAASLDEPAEQTITWAVISSDIGMQLTSDLEMNPRSVDFNKKILRLKEFILLSSSSSFFWYVCVSGI
ncbi:hypothetical protein EYF80_050781 [Liparis tanakae]|uniref:Uncharacterized protein n=1 Tax=Liparis tanakae TaxID=230148 RepID=A0A4Z2FD43_9TELE|nr:hypothetical protein EYF80_050781 [Liparis tanakae]